MKTDKEYLLGIISGDIKEVEGNDISDLSLLARLELAVTLRQTYEYYRFDYKDLFLKINDMLFDLNHYPHPDIPEYSRLKRALIDFPKYIPGEDDDE